MNKSNHFSGREAITATGAQSVVDEAARTETRHYLKFLRGGRLIKVQGILASCAPMVSGLALAASLALAAGPAMADVNITATADVDSTAGTGIKYVTPGPATTPIRQDSCRLMTSEDNHAPIFRGT